MRRMRFWHLSHPESTRGLAEWADEGMELGEGIDCPIDPDHARAGKLRLGNLSILLTSRILD